MARIVEGLLALAIAATLPSCFFMDIDPRSIPPQRPAAGMVGVAGFLHGDRARRKAMTKVSPTGEVIGHYPLPRSGGGVAFDAEEKAWVSTDDGIYRMAPDGKNLGKAFEGAVATHAIDAKGTAWVAFTEAADRGHGTARIARVATTGTFEILGTAEGGKGPAAIAFDAAGNAWITNEQGGDVTKLSPAGTVLGTYPVGKSPRGIACDGEGNAW